MRRVLYPLVVVLLALTLHHFWPEEDSRSSAGEFAARPEAPAAVRPTASIDAPGESLPVTEVPATTVQRAPVTEPSAAEVTAAPTGDAAATDDVPRARVFGQVVDSDARPVAGFALELSSVGEVWRAGLEVPTLSRGPWTTPGWRAEIDADGRFTFEVPVPTADWVTLYGRDELLLGIVGRDFGPAGGRNEPRLVVGDNDLGTLVAPRTGALAGQVVDAGGAPLAGARVQLDGQHPGGYSVGTATGPDGRYVLGHVPPRPALLSATLEGYLAASAAEPAEARLGETRPGPTLRLERAPTIAGLVVDEAGAPLAGVRVWGWPVGSGRGAGATTGADGRFVVHLPQDEPYSLEIDRDPRFEPWGGRTTSTTFEPGTADLRITLKRAARMTVVVVDAATGAPVERFAVRTGMRRAELGDHPDGRVEVAAEPGHERTLAVEAPGYVPTEVPVAFDEAGVPLQTVRLEPGARVTARAVLGDRPVAGARVTLGPAMLPNVPGAAIDPNDIFGESWHSDVQGEAARQRTDSTNADGRFEFSGLAPGTYRLALDDDEAAPHVVSTLSVAARATLDLGDIALAAGATLRVTVRLAGGESPVGLEYETGRGFGRDTAIERADGTFELTGLAAGEHEVRLRADGQRLVEDVVRAFEVRPGETREVLIDLSAEPISDVTVRVTANGVPVAGAMVVLEDTGESSWTARLAATDAEGVARGRAAAGHTVRAVASEGELRLGRSAPFALTPGEVPRVALEASVGTLVLQFPNDLALPDNGGFDLSLQSLDGAGQPEEQGWLSINGATPKSAFAAFGVPWRTPRVELGRIATGRYSGHLNAWRLDEEQFAQVPIVPALAVVIEVRRGEVCTIDVPGR
jgi:protocatechuate 3,4-dioxygenase beta subunit